MQLEFHKGQFSGDLMVSVIILRGQIALPAVQLSVVDAEVAAKEKRLKFRNWLTVNQKNKSDPC